MPRHWLAILTVASMLTPAAPPPVFAQSASPPAADQGDHFSNEQLDALLASIALYPDNLMTQTLMAASFPLQIVEAKRWLDDPAHKALKGEALADALKSQDWDPSVKATVAVPQVLAMLNSKLDWTQQVGYAFINQQADVLKSIQRLRRQAQAANNLQSGPQQVVKTEKDTVIIEQAQPDVVYVPTYNPEVVYGAWPYPAYPPVYVPPPPGYYAGSALVAGLAFGAGLAITASLWDVGRPNWYGGNVNVNVNRYNNINVNHAAINQNNWHAGAGANGRRPGGNFNRPPSGPVGRPGGPGRQNVNVPGSAVNRPNRPGSQTPAIGNNTRPGANGGGVQRPNSRPGANGGGERFNPSSRPGGGMDRPGAGGGGERFGDRGGGAFSGVNDGRQARDFGARGGQSRQGMQRSGGGGHFGGRHR